jgi:hypothetical protein
MEVEIVTTPRNQGERGLLSDDSTDPIAPHARTAEANIARFVPICFMEASWKITADTPYPPLAHINHSIWGFCSW